MENRKTVIVIINAAELKSIKQIKEKIIDESFYRDTVYMRN